MLKLKEKNINQQEVTYAKRPSLSLSSTHTHTLSLHHPQKLSPIISLNDTHMQTQLLCVSLALSQTHTLISPSNLP